MATTLDPALAKKPFTNWLKGALAVLFAREGLTEFVQNEISDFQRDLLQSIFVQNAIPSGTTCSSCTTANVLKCPTQEFCGRKRPCKLHDPSVQNKTPNQKCPQNICHHIKDAIAKHHRFQAPTWQITDATKWCSDAVEIGKCYLPSLIEYGNKNSFAEIDFNGTVGIIISNIRFQNKMTAQLNQEPNLCSKVRKMINDDIRHSASFELSDIQLARCIDGLLDLLRDSKFLRHDQHAKDAVDKIDELKNNTLVITAGDITKVLEEDISKRISEQQQEAIQSILDHLAKVQEVSVASLGEIIEARDAAIKAIQQEAEQQIKNVKQSVKETDDVLFKGLKEDIITYYLEHESVIPVTPLVDEHNVPIEDLYVLTPMWAYKNSYYEPSKNRQKGDETSGNDGQDKQKIKISGLFLCGDVRYRKIYITANAGFGKTSLSQKLTMIWCQSQSPLESSEANYEEAELTSEEAELVSEETKLGSEETDLDSEETDLDSEEDEIKSEKAALDTLRYFDLLFLLHLRDYQCESKCNLDDLIIKMVSDKLSRNMLYTKEFLQRCLHEKKCLIILDGLDEWAHPGHCTRKPEAPHNNHPGSCTVLTTTRDWKIGTIGLSPKDIDRRVEISMLDNKTRKLLEKNAICILNERNLNLAGKNIADFDKKVKTVQVGDIIYNPYILLQLMCVFFGGLPMGKSKCEIYSNITEFTLERGLNKSNLPDVHVQTNDNAQVPNCMKENETCTRYFILLMKLGKLAFYTLFSVKRESSLIFDRRIVAQYMTEQEIEFCLKVGLLCQTKDSSIIAVKRYHVFFQHKSVQEFFSAISRCDVYSADARIIPSYQSMQMQCLQESMRNGNDSCPIYLYVVLARYPPVDLSTLKTVIHFNKGHVKSLLLDRWPSLTVPDDKRDETTAFMQSLDPGVFTSLETLRVDPCIKEPVWLADILNESVRTLKCLTLTGYYTRHSLSAISITALTGLTCLQSLYLHEVNTTHSNLKCLYDYITQTTTLTQLKLKIDCWDHRGQYRDCDVTLDLHRLNKLKILYLVEVPCIELHVNTSCLEKLEFRRPQFEKMTARASATLWQDLLAAPVLSSLTLSWMSSCQEMIQTIPTLTQLQHLQLEWIDMDDVIPRVSPDMIQLERVKLNIVTMSSAAWLELFVSVGQLPRSITVELSIITMTYQEWRELLLSVGQLQHPVTVELSSCRGPSREEWQAIVNVIKTTPTLSLLPDLSINVLGWASLTLKNKTV